MAASDKTEGVIRPTELYTLPEVKRRLGMKDAAWWNLRDSGLRTIRLGQRTYILGKDILETFERLASQKSCASGSKSSKSRAVRA